MVFDARSAKCSEAQPGSAQLWFDKDLCSFSCITERGGWIISTRYMFISQIIKRKGFGGEKLNCEGPEERIKQ